MVGNESNPVYLWSRWICNPVALRSAVHNVVLLFTFADFCGAEFLIPAEALDRYLATSGDRQSGYTGNPERVSETFVASFSPGRGRKPQYQQLRWAHADGRNRRSSLRA